MSAGGRQAGGGPSPRHPAATKQCECAGCAGGRGAERSERRRTHSRWHRRAHTRGHRASSTRAHRQARREAERGAAGRTLARSRSCQPPVGFCPLSQDTRGCARSHPKHTGACGRSVHQLTLAGHIQEHVSVWGWLSLLWYPKPPAHTCLTGYANTPLEVMGDSEHSPPLSPHLQNSRPPS